MNTKDPHSAGPAQSVGITRHSPERVGVRSVVTRDQLIIREWASQHGAQPATGEATASGPATIVATDGGVGIRFNFPGFAPFRPIGWEEWFAHFDKHQLQFVFEEQDTSQVAARAHQIFESHGDDGGDERDDWFKAERDLRQQAGGGSPSVRYRFAKAATNE
jgi:hypothetical protein